MKNRTFCRLRSFTERFFPIAKYPLESLHVTLNKQECSLSDVAFFNAVIILLLFMQCHDYSCDKNTKFAKNALDLGLGLDLGLCLALEYLHVGPGNSLICWHDAKGVTGHCKGILTLQ